MPADATYARLLRQVTRGRMHRNWLAKLRPHLEGRQVDLDEVLEVLVDEVAREFEADRATFYLVDHARRELVSRAAHLPEIAEIRLRLGEGVAGMVAANGEAVRVDHSDDDPRHDRRVDATTGYHTRSMMCVPVRDAEGSIVGVLQLLNKHNGPFSEADLARLQEVAHQIATLLDHTSLRGQLRPDHDKPLSFRFNFIVGESGGMRRVYERVERSAGTEATVLVLGETGTGKELIARAIHFNSPRREGPLVKVDCAALPETLIENELFGHEKGAFTGADREAEGKVAMAEGGTLFLDEIGELSLAVQGKLLRLLQDRRYLRVGSNQTRRASVRFVCATHRDLEQRVVDGAFRADLYYRLRVVEIAVPPLRDRGHVDLDRLVDHFLYEFARQHDRPGIRLTPASRAAMHSHTWPGNVRELEHCLESAVVLAPTDEITEDLLPFRRSTGSGGDHDGPPDRFITAPRPLREVELAYIKHVLALCEGNRTAAARMLQIGRNTLLRKLKADSEQG